MRPALYSVTYSGLWYDDRALSLEEVIVRAAEVGFGAVEIDGKRPHGFPLDWSERRRRDVRALAEQHGVEIACVAANNDFTKAVPEERESQILAVTELIRLAADLGAPLVRIFAAWPGVTLVNGSAAYDFTRNEAFRIPATRLERWTWCREAIEEVARVAERSGVVLTLQNHKPLIDEPVDLLDMVREVDSEHVRCTMDCHLMPRQDAETIEEAVQAAGSLHVFSHYAGEYRRDADGSVVPKRLPGRVPINYPAYVAALAGIGYQGYLSYELCHPFFPERRELGRLEHVHEQVELAHEYMATLLADVAAAQAA
jgi:sugar phosphate isomerase/epimerase